MSTGNKEFFLRFVNRASSSPTKLRCAKGVDGKEIEHECALVAGRWKSLYKPLYCLQSILGWSVLQDADLTALLLTRDGVDVGVRNVLGDEAHDREHLVHHLVLRLCKKKHFVSLSLATRMFMVSASWSGSGTERQGEAEEYIFHNFNRHACFQ